MKNNNSSKNVLYHWPANTNGTSWSKADWRNMQSKINCIIMICRFIHRFLTLICWLRYDITLKMVMMIAIRVDLSYHKMWEICIGEEYTFILWYYCFIMMLKWERNMLQLQIRANIRINWILLKTSLQLILTWISFWYSLVISFLHSSPKPYKWIIK